MAEMTKEEMEEARKLAEKKMRTVDYVVDTLDIRDDEEIWGGHSGWGLDSKGVITANYNIYENGYINDNSIDNYTLYVHEQKHRDNMENGIYEYPMSWEQAYKINMHDEISATMAELLQLREEYLQTGDISIFDKAPKLSFYKEAIKKGEIKPGSEYKVDFDKEMSFIVNGTRDMWVNQFGSSYVDQNLYFATASYDDSGKYAQYYDENYERAKKIAYNIGGVDFTKYMYKDVEIPEAANAKMIEEIANSPSMQEYYHLTDAQVFEKSGFPPYDGSISLYEYKQLLQHQMAVNNKFSNIWNEEGQKYTPQGYMEYLVSDETKKEEKKLYETICSKNADFRKKYPNFAAFQYSQHEYDREQLNNALQENNEAFIDKMVEYQAAEYAKTGKDFPQSNPENYQKALNKLYCGAYDVLKPDETKLKSELSKPAEKLQRGNAWERTMENYLKSVGLSPEDAEYKAHNLAQENKIIGGFGCFVGGPFVGAYNKVKDLKHRMTHIVDEIGEEQNVGLWGKIKHKAKEIKKNFTTKEVHNKDGSVTVSKRSVIEGVKDKISKWLKTEKTEVKNEPIHPVNKGAPKYPKWSKDNRVSEVQHRTIPDLTKPIIKQPTKSKADEQQDHTSFQTATASKMKSDTKKAKVAAGRPKNKSTSSQSKTILKSTMKKDASKAQKMSQNVGKQKTTIKKVAKIGHKPPSQKQVFKDLHDKVFGR